MIHGDGAWPSFIGGQLLTGTKRAQLPFIVELPDCWLRRAGGPGGQWSIFIHLHIVGGGLWNKLIWVTAASDCAYHTKRCLRFDSKWEVSIPALFSENRYNPNLFLLVQAPNFSNSSGSKLSLFSKPPPSRVCLNPIPPPTPSHSPLA